EVCAEVCDALQHAHTQGVVHRDIKPDNLMLTADNLVKVMDFGIARKAGQSRQTRKGNTEGKPHYMDPYQLTREEVDGRADLYSLGAVLFESITGKIPFEADSDYQLMMKHLNEAPPRLGGHVEGVPRSMDRVIQRAMSKDRQSRFSTASELRSALSVAATAPDPLGGSSRREDPPLLHDWRSEEHTSELQSRENLVCRL